MTTVSKPLTPMDLFREFSALEHESEGYTRIVYGIAVDLVDGMLKGKMSSEWKTIYSHIRDAARDNSLRDIEDEEIQAWNVVIETLEIAIALLD